MKNHPVISLLAMCTLLSTSAIAAPPSLQQSFRECESIRTLPIASDLFWLIPKGEDGTAKVTAAQFERQHRKSIVPGSLTAVASFEGGGRYETTRVELVGQSFAPDLAPKALSALSCPEGCCIMVWTLEFGRLNAKAKAGLVSWVRALSPNTEDVTRPEIAEDHLGNVSLVCDLTM